MACHNTITPELSLRVSVLVIKKEAAKTGAEASITRAYQPLGGSLSGYKVRVSQVSALAGRGYSTTTVIT